MRRSGLELPPVPDKDAALQALTDYALKQRQPPPGQGNLMEFYRWRHLHSLGRIGQAALEGRWK